MIAAFATALLAKKRPLIFGDGATVWDFTYVDNVVQANLLAARSKSNLAGTVINVACGNRITVNELAAKMAALLDRSDLSPHYEPERTGDVKHSLADLRLARQLLGYEPIVAFDAGLEATVDWYRRSNPG